MITKNKNDVIFNLKNQIINEIKNINPNEKNFDDIDYIDNVYNLINIYYHLNGLIENGIKSFKIVFPETVNFFGGFKIVFPNGDCELKHEFDIDKYTLIHGGNKNV